MKIFGFIFARGGSKGLVGKNIKLLHGKPLIGYSIESAQETPEIDKVFVSTDDAEIAKIAETFGAIVIDRPQVLAGDSSAEWDAWRHAIQWVRKNHGDFDLFVSLPATSPLRAVIDTQGAIRKISKSDADICISTTPANRSPFFNMVVINNDGYAELVNSPKESVVRRQDAPIVFDITTVVYVAKSEFILQEYGIFSGKVTTINVPKERAVDIDDIYDFMLAESIISGKL